MQIPGGFTIPDFVLELVRVAPEDWNPPTDPSSAKAELQGLISALTTPAVLATICHLVVQLSKIEDDVDNHRLEGFHDVYNQQQLIGEKRGLRQLFAKLHEIHELLTDKAKQAS